MAQGLPTLAVIGGTGNIGWGLALRWSWSGYPVIVGSRTSERGEAAASEINAAVKAAKAGAVEVRGMANSDAAAACDIAVLTVPFAAQRDTFEEIRPALAGKILVDTTVPLVPPKVMRVQLPEGGSAAAMLQSIAGEEVRVVSAFQNIAAAHLRHLRKPIDCDVLVCGDDRSAREQVIGLVEAAGMRGWHAGPIANSAAAEALTSVLLFINRHHNIAGAGIRITGSPGSGGS